MHVVDREIAFRATVATLAFIALVILVGCTMCGCSPPHSEYSLGGLASGFTSRDTDTELEDVEVYLDPTTQKPVRIHVGKFKNIGQASAVEKGRAETAAANWAGTTGMLKELKGLIPAPVVPVP